MALALLKGSVRGFGKSAKQLVGAYIKITKSFYVGQHNWFALWFLTNLIYIPHLLLVRKP